MNPEAGPKRFLIGLLILIGLLHMGWASASEALQGEIRLHAAKEDASWVGQELEIYLELWSDGFSFGEQHWVLPEVQGGYLLQTDSSTVKLNETRSGVAWQGLRYTFLFYPQQEGRLEIPPFDVRFIARAGYGSEPSPFEHRTPALYVDTRLPPGVDPGSLTVTSTGFSMEASWRPQRPGEGPIRLKVGDALRLEVVRKAQDVPGMVFAPIPEFTIEGLAVYAETPQLDDRINRGSLTGYRTDSVTFMCEQEGVFKIPELRFQWWDPEREVLSEEIIPAVELDVAVNPAFAGGASDRKEPGGRSINGKVWFGVLVLGLLLWFPARKLLRLLINRLQARRKEYKSGEAWAFQQLRSACRRGKPTEAYHAITRWLGRFDGTGMHVTMLQMAKTSGDKALVREILNLQERVAVRSTGEWSGRKLAQLLENHRVDAKRVADNVHVLSPLNP